MFTESNADEDDFDIYLPPDHNLTDDEVAACWQVAEIYEQFSHQQRIQTLSAARQLHPEIEMAKVVGQVFSISSVLQHLRNILLESYDENEELQEQLLKLSTTIAAHSSLCDLMFEIFLCVTDVTKTMLSDENYDRIGRAADDVVRNHGLQPMQHYHQLELSLDA